MSRKVFWDTNVLIYHIEQVPEWKEHIARLVEWQKEQGMSIVTSSFSLAEILVRPLSAGKHSLARQYRELICELGALPFGVDEAGRFARIRAQYPEVKPADAIQLACASTHGVDLFLASDRRLKWLSVENIASISTLQDWYETYVGKQS